jgi:hypothetical protein
LTLIHTLDLLKWNGNLYITNLGLGKMRYMKMFVNVFIQFTTYLIADSTHLTFLVKHFYWFLTAKGNFFSGDEEETS